MKHKFTTGQQYGSWTIIGNKSGNKIEVKCSCGTQRSVNIYSLIRGNSKNCGCQRRLKGQGDLTGTVLYRNFSRLEKKGELSMSYDEAVSVYNSQGASCVLTGQTLTPDTAKLEKIYADSPATSNNVAWVHNSVSPYVTSTGIYNAASAMISVASNNSFISNNIFETLGMKPAERKQNVQKSSSNDD